VFCPNCGTQNDSAATPCKKCGFKLSGVSASKFKGTMMLNSDQTAQDLVAEHKQKRAEAGLDAENKPPASPNPGANPGTVPPKAVPSVPPLGSGSSVPPQSSGLQRGVRSVLQPPRATTTKRRMGGTMLGVAPPAGGVIPPAPDLTATPPPVRAVEPALKAEPTLELGRAVPVGPAIDEPKGGPDPYAGTVAMGAAEEQQQDTPRLSPAPAGRSAPLAATSELVEEHSRHIEAAPATTDPEPARPVAAGRVPAVTAPLPAQPSAAEQNPREDAPPSRPRGIRPFEIVLIVATCGLYGIFLLIRQRKSPSP